MAHVKYEPCPKCRAKGRDRRGDNLGRYPDGSGHCFSCGNHEPPKGYVRVKKDDHGNANKAVLPSDFTREVPAAGWKWLLQYGLPYTYWRPFVGWTEKDQRLVFCIPDRDNPRFSQGRYLGPTILDESGNPAGRQPRKWFFWGDGHGFVDVLEPKERSTDEVVLVEDLISQHKVGQVATAICLYGTHIHPKAMSVLRYLQQPVVLWLDEDQRGALASKINRIQTLLDLDVRSITTNKDPKEYSVEEIRAILRG